MKLKKFNRRGDVWISVVLYVLIISIGLFIILIAVTPLLTRMKDKSTFSDAKGTMLGIEQQISEISRESPGSQRVIPVDLKSGSLDIGEDTIVYRLETESKVIDPKSKVELGNILITGDADVESYEDDLTYVLTNSRIKVHLVKTNATYNISSTKDILINMTLFENNVSLGQNFVFSVAGADDSCYGPTELLNRGTRQGFATVVAHCSNSVCAGQACRYDLYLTLDSQADFIKANIRNLFFE